jgi:hypothetical protein
MPQVLRRSRVLFFFAAYAAALLPGSASANSPCTIAGSTETCTGDQSGGIANPPPGISVLNVNSLTTGITPPAGTDGIVFQNNAGGSVTINSDVTPFGFRD